MEQLARVRDGLPIELDGIGARVLRAVDDGLHTIRGGGVASRLRQVPFDELDGGRLEWRTLLLLANERLDVVTSFPESQADGAADVSRAASHEHLHQDSSVGWRRLSTLARARRQVRSAERHRRLPVGRTSVRLDNCLRTATASAQQNRPRCVLDTYGWIAHVPGMLQVRDVTRRVTFRPLLCY